MEMKEIYGGYRVKSYEHECVHWNVNFTYQDCINVESFQDKYLLQVSHKVKFSWNLTNRHVHLQIFCHKNIISLVPLMSCFNSLSQNYISIATHQTDFE